MNEMARASLRWDKYEVALLIETYINIVQKVKNSEESIEELSQILRSYAIKKGLKIDNKYRNKNGIGMKIQEVRYLFTGKGMQHYSKLEQECVELYKENPSVYAELLAEAKDIVI